MVESESNIPMLLRSSINPQTYIGFFPQWSEHTKTKSKSVVVFWFFNIVVALISLFPSVAQEWKVVKVERWHQLRRVHLRRSSGNFLRSSASGRPAKKYKKVTQWINEWENILFALGLDLLVRVWVSVDSICFRIINGLI